VRGDPARLRQVLLNLAGNAVKFTLEGSVRITVSGPSGGLFRFEVADTGIGIDPTKQGSIFDSFTQADGSHSRHFGGTGLGLTITRRLVQLMHGRLWVESAIGAGSRFFVEFPLEPVVAAAPTAPVKAVSDRLPPSLRILVAEDNPINQTVVCAMLKRQGCEIVLAGNGAEACHQFLAATFDLVLMDVQMPEVDGLEATRRIREEEMQRHLPRTPVLALTAHASRQQHEQCLACGMDAVMTKPVNMPELVRHIGALVAHNAVC
jgi:CheY-like chemotaxis protein